MAAQAMQAVVQGAKRTVSILAIEPDSAIFAPSFSCVLRWLELKEGLQNPTAGGLGF